MKIVDYYKNTIGDMQNEKDFYSHYNDFEYNHDFVIFLFIWLNLKTFPRASDDFLFNSYIYMLLSEIVKLLN